MSDHCVINSVINSRIKATHKLITCRTYKNFDELISKLFDAFTDFNIKTDSNIEELRQIFMMKLLSVANIFVPRAALCPEFLMILSTSLKSVTTCIREQYLRMIMYSLDSIDQSEIWLLIKSVLKRKNLLMTLYVAPILPKIYVGLFQFQQEETYTVIMYPLILPVIQ